MVVGTDASICHDRWDVVPGARTGILNAEAEMVSRVARPECRWTAVVHMKPSADRVEWVR